MSTQRDPAKTIMEHFKKFKLIKAIIKRRGLIKPLKWKVSKKIVKDVSKRFGTSSRDLRRNEDVVDGQLEQDTFLSMQILDQIRKPEQLYFFHEKKSLKSIIAEAKSELGKKKLQLSDVTDVSPGLNSRQDYVDLDEASRSVESPYSDYVEMS